MCMYAYAYAKQYLVRGVTDSLFFTAVPQSGKMDFRSQAGLTSALAVRWSPSPF